MPWTLRLVLLAAMPLLSSCETPPALPPSGRDVQFRTDTSATGYFGESRTWGDTVWLPIFATTLQGMKEPPLRGAKLVQSGRIMRFLWQRSFHPDVAVRVSESAAGCSVVTTVRTQYQILLPPINSIGGAAETEPVTQLTLRRDSATTAMATCLDLFERLEAIGVTANRPHSPGGGVDGAHWLFERVDASGHGCLETWSPDSTSSSAYWNAGMAFLRAGRALPANARELY